MAMNHYATLGIDPDADQETIRQAWVAAARVNHPDALAGASDEERHNAELKMRAINEAWRILGSSKLKVQYDEELSQAQETPDEIEDPWSDDWFDLEASDPPGFEVGQVASLFANLEKSSKFKVVVGALPKDAVTLSFVGARLKDGLKVCQNLDSLFSRGRTK